MASLDDFFKKRDKKKKTTKSKLDIDEFAKKLEATTITGGDAEEGGDTQETINSSENATVTNNSSSFASASVGSVGIVSGSGNVVTNGGGEQVDEEWKPFDSDENKDYTGLRININNWKVEDEYGENEGGFNDNDKKPSFKWGEKASQAKNKKDDDFNEEEVEEKAKPISKPATVETTSKSSNIADIKTETPATGGGSYIPPALRRQQAESSDKPSVSNAASETQPNKYVPPSMRNKTTTDSAIPSTSVNYRRPNKSQPNIMDTMEFPTLDSTDNGPSEKVSIENSNERFELPKKSGKVDQKSSKNMIDLGNAFSALSS